MQHMEDDTKNQDDNLEDNKYNSLKLTYSPLTETNKAKIIGFFVVPLFPIFFFYDEGGNALLLGIPIMAIALFALHQVITHYDFSPIERAKENMKLYLMGLGILATLMLAYTYYDSYHNIVDYAKYNQVKEHNPNVNAWDYKKHAPYIEIKTGALIVAGLLITKIATLLLMSIFDRLFFRPLEEHKDWIAKNGIFSDKKDKSKIMGRDNLSSYSVADEILKWNNLLEKNVISKEEFDKIKTKIMNGDKV